MMATPPAQFHGTQAETAQLLEAVAHNCTCALNNAGEVAELCPPHRMLFTDQRALDGLLFMRTNVLHLRREEGMDAHGELLN